MCPRCCRKVSPRTNFDRSQIFKEAVVRTFLLLISVVSLGLLAGCGRGSGGSTPKGVPTGGTANGQPIAVDGGPVAGAIYPNGAFTTVTICNPGTTTCQAIDGILVDTGS